MIRNVEVTLGRSGQQPGPALGVVVGTVDFNIQLPFPVEVDAGDIGGPSAGLLIALTVYDLADEGDLTGGRVIAGTDTIDAQGNVGPVGGVAQKIETALDAGARTFLAPPTRSSRPGPLLETGSRSSRSRRYRRRSRRWVVVRPADQGVAPHLPGSIAKVAQTCCRPTVRLNGRFRTRWDSDLPAAG